MDLPEASTGKAQDQTKIVISIDAQGAVSLNRKSIDAATLIPQIKSLIVKDQLTMVVINADEKVGHGRVVEIMDTVQQIPGIKIGIATKRK